MNTHNLLLNKFYVQGGHFWLNDQPHFIHAAEFHYFRTPPEQWAHRLGLLQTAGFNTLATYIPWLWHQLEEGVADLHGRSHPMRDLAAFLDLAAEMGFWLIPRPGPYIMAETINEGIPPWVFSNYPQVAFVDQNQNVLNLASYLHPDFLACIQQWYQAIFSLLTPRQITHGGRIIMIQLDNEMGMPQWVRNVVDTNPDTMARFAAFLQERYGRHLPTRYPTADLPTFLQEGILQPDERFGAIILEDYRRFYREQLHEYAAFLWAEARANGMEVLPIVNIHGFMNGGKTFPIGLSQLVEVMEMEGMISATDVYPLFIGEGNFHQLMLVNETTKALQNKEQALFSVEFQSGGNQDFSGVQSSFYDLHSRLCIASGMRAINHYLFFAGENDPVLSPVKRHDWGPPVRLDGTLRKHYHRYARLSGVLHVYGRDLILSQPQTVTTIGFLLDNFMTEVNNAFTQPATKLITHQREVILFDFIARGLALTHRPFNAVEITRSDLNVAEVPICWVMIEKQCPATVQQKLVDYVKQGGRLLLIGRLCEEDFEHTPCTILQDALNIQHVTTDMPFRPTTISAFHHQAIPVSFVESYSGEFDEVFATRASGEVVGFLKTMGRGKVVHFGAAMAADTLDDLDVLHQLALKMACPPLFKLSDWADVRLSRGDKGSFLFINNYQDDPVQTTIEYENRLLFDGQAVTVPARQGLILPLEWQFRPDILIHYATSEIVGIADDGLTLTLKMAHDQFAAELTLSHYSCDDATTIEAAAGTQRVRVQSRGTGAISLRKRDRPMSVVSPQAIS
jgi:beta-galactosidase